MSAKHKSLVHTRGYIRSRVTKHFNEISDGLDDFEQTELLEYLASLREDSASLKELDDKILEKLWNAQQSDDVNGTAHNKELDAISAYKVKLNRSITLLEQKLYAVS